MQTISITLQGAALEKCPADLPSDLDIGQVIVDRKIRDNMLPLPAVYQGRIEIALLTQHGEELRAKALHLETHELGAPAYVEDFP